MIFSRMTGIVVIFLVYKLERRKVGILIKYCDIFIFKGVFVGRRVERL